RFSRDWSSDVCSSDLPGVGHFTRDDPFSISLWLNPATSVPRAVVLHHSKAPVDAGSRGYELLLEGGRVAFGLHHTWPENSLKVRSEERRVGKECRCGE